jgi:hypothetical protein
MKIYWRFIVRYTFWYYSIENWITKTMWPLPCWVDNIDKSYDCWKITPWNLPFTRWK